MATQYRTDQIGSLIRPPELLAAREQYKAGRIDRQALRTVEDAAILAALDGQRRAGVEIFSDGEMRRDSFNSGVSEAAEGFVDAYPVIEQRRPDGTIQRVEMHTKPVSGRVRQVRRITEQDALFLAQHVRGPFKITMISPCAVAHGGWKLGLTDRAYASEDELLQDVAGIIRGEMQALVRDGASYLQLDEGFTRYVRADWRESAQRQGLDVEKLLEADIEAENACYDAVRSDDVTLASHLCRGNRVSYGGGAGSYDWLAERLLTALHVDRFLFEYDSDRAGGFEPLRFLPKGKIVALGLVTTKNGVLETQDDLLRRIDAAAKFCPIDQLALCPQCGFQSAANPDAAFMTMDQQWRKLELIADTARKVWG